MNATAPRELADSLTDAVLDEAASAGQALEAAAEAVERAARRLPWPLLALHVFIIGNLTLQYLYAGYQVFFVLQPEGMVGPMFGRATSLAPELLMARRLYAIEAWIAFVGLAIYLGITEVLPRRRQILEHLAG